MTPRPPDTALPPGRAGLPHAPGTTCAVSTASHLFKAGARDIAGPAVGTAAMGLVVGAAMVHSGLPLPLVLAMSALVFSSASQLVGAPLLVAGLPWPSVLLIGLLLNVRFVVFSVQWRRYLGHLPWRQRLWSGYLAGDPIYACVQRRFPLPAGEAPAVSQREALRAYFLGASLTNWAVWQVFSLLGILLADRLGDPQSLRFIGVLALLGLALPMLDRAAAVCAAAAAAAVALLATGWPLGAPMGVAIAAAMLAGLAAEAWERRR